MTAILGGHVEVAFDNVGDAGLAIKVMVGGEYAKYYKDLHVKAATYTE